ncbi:hypothetical protein K1X76_12080 [bacterium]|nr:hypothetical protein [bacterium]
MTMIPHHEDAKLEAVMIDRLQNQLECLYDIGVPERVKHYLIDRHEAQNLLTLGENQKLPKELLLVRQSEEETVEVALFLDDKLLQNLTQNNPFEFLNEENIADFCIMIEGVSHFVYFLWKAYKQTPITQLEMELQAEIDKFVLLYLFLRSDHTEEISKIIFDRLFENFKLIENLSAEQEERYITASQLASKYCHYLKNKYRNPQEMQKMIEEVRYFYNLSQEQKISFIHS